MKKEKAPQPVKANSASQNEPIESTGCAPSAPQRRPRKRTLSPRIVRALHAFLARWQAGIKRESLDSIAGASNSPAIVDALRHSYDIGIDTEMVYSRDRDGNRCSFGVYTLTADGRIKARALLEAFGLLNA